MSKKLLCVFYVVLIAMVVTFPITSKAQTNFSLYTLDMKRECAISYSRLEDYQLLCVEIDGNVYRSEYGTGAAPTNYIVMNYPVQPTGKEVSVWVESKDGEMSDIFTKTIEDCEIKLEDSRTIDVTPNTLKGDLTKASGFGDYAIVKAGGKEYRGEVNYLDPDSYSIAGEFTVTFPPQRYEDTLTVTAYDAHGCASEPVTKKIQKSYILGAEFSSNDVLKTKIKLDKSLYQHERLCVQFGDNIYYSDYAAYNGEISELTYPEQEIGAKCSVWIETKQGYYSDPVTGKVFDRKILINDPTTFYPNYVAGSSAYADIFWENTKLKSAIATIDGEVYEGEVDRFFYTIDYPIQKMGTKITITLTDEYNYTSSKTLTIKNTPIPLKIDSISYGQEKLTGTTLPKSKVTAKIGSKTYKATANKKGDFSIKIPSNKAGTKIKVNSVAPNTCYNNKSVTIKKVSSFLLVTNNIYKNTTTLKVECDNVFKGDVIKVTIGKNQYTQKISANAKSKKFTFKIKAAPVGTKVKVVLYDKYNVKRDDFNTKVYLSNTITLGMTKSQAKQTTWGSPSSVNNFSGLEEWIYTGRYQSLYVYFKNGKVDTIITFTY